MDHRLPATPAMAREFSELFVNRRAYTIQSLLPHPESGRHYYFRPKTGKNAQPVSLSEAVIRQHLEGRLTIGLYATWIMHTIGVASAGPTRLILSMVE